jgi:hypothetical protein
MHIKQQSKIRRIKMIFSEQEHKPDGELQICLAYNPQKFAFEDIDVQLAVVPGEADGPDWHWIVRLTDGSFALIEGGCDYTGWDCQSDAESTVSVLLDNVVNAAHNDGDGINVREQLVAQLKGTQPYGTRW